MKILKVILLLILICKSSIGFSLDFGVFYGQDCCSTTIECGDTDQKEDTKHNCCGTSCDCLCCAHVFMHEKTASLSLFHNILVAKNPILFESNNYQHNFISGVWQPPRLIK